MRWDSKRTVPWKRLLIEWVVVGAVMVLISTVFTDNPVPDVLAAVLIGGGIYLLVGAVLAKFGYARKTLTELRAAAGAAQQQQQVTGGSSRSRPAPTKRTSTGPSQRPRKKKR